LSGKIIAIIFDSFLRVNLFSPTLSQPATMQACQQRLEGFNGLHMNKRMSVTRTFCTLIYTVLLCDFGTEGQTISCQKLALSYRTPN
jgi:hypothetical protein